MGLQRCSFCELSHTLGGLRWYSYSGVTLAAGSAALGWSSLFIYVCVWVCAHVCRHHRGQERATHALELKLQQL